MGFIHFLPSFLPTVTPNRALLYFLPTDDPISTDILSVIFVFHCLQVPWQIISSPLQKDVLQGITAHCRRDSTVFSNCLLLIADTNMFSAINRQSVEYISSEVLALLPTLSLDELACIADGFSSAANEPCALALLFHLLQSQTMLKAKHVVAAAKLMTGPAWGISWSKLTATEKALIRKDFLLVACRVSPSVS